MVFNAPEPCFEVHFLTPRRCRPWTKSEGRRQTVSCLFFHPGGMAVRCGWMRQRRSFLVQIKLFSLAAGDKAFLGDGPEISDRTDLGEFYPGQCAGAGCGQGRGCEILARGRFAISRRVVDVANKRRRFRLPDGTVAYLEMHSVQQILKDKGLDSSGDVQMFHTQNVLRRIVRYMPYQSGMTIKVTAAQTNIRKPLIVTDTPSARFSLQR